MTPKTQSVCKHCGAPEGLHSTYQRRCFSGYEKGTLTALRDTSFEPVAEPASTGEPTRREKIDKSLKENPRTGLAARPSEPSAPQPSTPAEWRRQESCSECDGDGCANCAPQTSAELCPICGKSDAHTHQAEVVTRWFKSRAPQPVSGDAPKAESPVKFKHNGFEHAVDRMAQGVIDSHPGSTLTAAYRAVALELFPAGAAPKVEEIARLAKSFMTRWVAERYVQKYPGHVLCEIDILAATELAKDFAVELLRPYFPPASQTPQWTGVNDGSKQWEFPRELAVTVTGKVNADGKQQEETDQSATSAQSEGQNAQSVLCPEPQQTATKREKDPGKTLATTASQTTRTMCSADIGKVVMAELATPASTARTDAPNFATNETEQRQIDIINLRLYARLAEENEWKDDVIHWSVFQQTLEAIATRLERLPLPAAPGSVPQAQGCSCEPGNDANATECHNLGAKSCVGVPQAEPPKDGE